MRETRRDIVTVISNLQKELQTIRNLALVAPTAGQREMMLQTATLVEHCLRDFDREA